MLRAHKFVPAGIMTPNPANVRGDAEAFLHGQAVIR
jgi:hypothetical protein